MTKVYDIVVVGAGAAGMTAGIYGARAGKGVLIFEKKTYGGQILNTTRIENYPAAAHISGEEFSKKLYEQTKELGVEFRFEEVLEISQVAEEGSDSKSLQGSKGAPETESFGGETRASCFRVLTDEGEYFSRTVILANGSVERKLGLSDEERLVGRGVSYCATCDGEFFRGKTVAVNGGGNTALWSALYLANLAGKVYIIHRRGEFRADKALVKKVAGQKNVEFLMNKKIVELSGKEKLEKIVLEETGGKTGGSKDGVKREELTIEGLFIAIGRVPNNEKFKGLVELDEEGYIKAGENCQTSRAGVFVAGDARKKKLNQLVTATADGAIAATGAIEFLNK